MIRDKNSCAEDASSKTVRLPQILGRYLLGGTSSGPQIKAARKPSNCSKFIERLSPKRARTALRWSSSASVKGLGFMGQPGAFSWDSSISYYRCHPLPKLCKFLAISSIAVDDGHYRSLNFVTSVAIFGSRIRFFP